MCTNYFHPSWYYISIHVWNNRTEMSDFIMMISQLGPMRGITSPVAGFVCEHKETMGIKKAVLSTGNKYL